MGSGAVGLRVAAVQEESKHAIRNERRHALLRGDTLTPGTHARKPKPVAQFDIGEALKRRPVERLLLTNQVLHGLVTWIGRIGLTAMVWPRFFAPFRCRVTRYPMALPGLDGAFAGYRILFLSDLHIGKAKQGYLRQTLGQIAALRPDLILIGGDLIDYGRESLERLAELLPLFQATDGAYTIFGNHDYHEYSWRHVGPRSAKRVIHRRMVAMLEKSPVKLLRNESVTIRRGGGRLQIVGMDEMWCNRLDPQKAFTGIDPAAPTLCVLHNPDGFEYLQQSPWDWLLCGHSHGGQVDVPVAGPIYVPMVHRKLLRGFYAFAGGREGRRVMFVSTGVGYTKPLRFRVPPEMTVFELRPGGAGEGVEGVRDAPVAQGL